MEQYASLSQTDNYMYIMLKSVNMDKEWISSFSSNLIVLRLWLGLGLGLGLLLVLGMHSLY